MARRKQPLTLKDEFRRRGITVRKAARLAGLSKSVIYKALSGKRVSTETAATLASSLGLTIEELDAMIEG